MSQFMQVVVDNLDVMLSVIFGLLLFLITFFRTGSIKKSIKNLKEFETMITYKTAKDREELPVKAQEFSNTVPDYILDPVTNELERSPVDKDVQAYIDSYVDVALERALQRFLPQDVIEDNDHIADYTQKSQDLAELGSAFDLAEDYREKYNLPDNYTFEQIMSFVSDKATALKTELQKQTIKKEVSESETQKEVK